MQQYPGLPPSYSPPGPAHQQQPLFIIIPGGGSKSGHKHPTIIPASAYARHGLDYQHHDYHSDHAHRAAARRLSPLLGRRSASLLKRGKSRAAATLAPSLVMTDQQQHASESAAGGYAVARPNIALHSPDGAGHSPGVLIASKTPKTKLTHELSAKTSHLANRFRARHRDFWSVQGSGTLTPGGIRSKAIGGGQSRFGRATKSLSDDSLGDSSRYFMEGEEEASALDTGESLATDSATFNINATSPSKHNNDDKLTSTSSSTETPPLPLPPPRQLKRSPNPSGTRHSDR